MKKMFVVDHGTYPFEILVCIDCEHKDVVKFIEKKKKYKLDSEEKEKIWMEGKGRTIMLSGGQTILRLDKLKKIEFHAILAHEIFHAVEFLFNRIDIKHERDISGEAFSYQIQYITGSIYEKLNNS